MHAPLINHRVRLAGRKSWVLAPDASRAVLSPKTAKKCPQNAGFSKVENRPTSIVATDWRPAAAINPADVPDNAKFLRRARS